MHKLVSFQFYLVIFFAPFYSFGQTNLDSLFSIWNDKSIDDSIRLKAVFYISWDGYLYTNPDSAFYYAEQQLKLAQKCKNLESQSSAYNTQGATYYLKGNHDSALYYFHKGLAIDEQLGDEYNMASSLNNIANIYLDKGDLPSGMEYFFKCLHIYEDVKDTTSTIVTYIGIGNVYFAEQEYEEALEYHQKAYDLSKLINDEKSIATSLINLAASNNNLGNDKKAKKFYLEAIDLYKKIKVYDFLPSAYNNMGTLFYNSQNYDSAHYYFTEGIEINNNRGQENRNSFLLNNLGKNYYSQGYYEDAIEHSLWALEIAKNISDIREQNAAYHALYEDYKAINNTSKALEMHEHYLATSDSMYNAEKRKDVMRYQFQYENDKQHLADSLNYQKQEEINKLIHQAELEKEVTQRYFLYGGCSLLLLIGGLLYRGYSNKKKDNLLIRAQKKEVEFQKELVEEKNKEITDSIAYAKRIQAAVLPPDKIVKEYLQNSFVIYLPKDIVAGDFYWMEHSDNKVIFAVADCTGHGVPGAMVSVICNNGLNRSVREHGLTEPGKILDKTREIVIQEFEKSEDEVKDGMDIAICSLEGNTLQYAGANNPIWIIRKNELIEIKGDKQPVGTFSNPYPFNTHTIKLEKGDAFYIFSDGFIDQFGGERGKKYKSVRLRKMLLSLQNLPFEKQKEALEKEFNDWKGELEQIDDVCFMGVQV